MSRLLLFKRLYTLHSPNYGVTQLQLKSSKTRTLHQQMRQVAGIRNDAYRDFVGLTQTRLQSTLPTNAEEECMKQRKLKKVSHLSKYADLLEVTNNDVSERKSRIKRLQAKRLQKFIAKTQQQILDKRSKVERVAKGKEMVQPVEYQKINMEAIDQSMLETDVYDDKPLIFFGKPADQAKQILEDKQRVENILKSFNNFRNIIESIEHERHETDISLEGVNQYNLKHNVIDADGVEAEDTYLLAEMKPKSIAAAKKSIYEVETAVTKKNKSRFKSKTHNSEEQERQAKERALRVNLTTYLNVCVSTGLLNRGIATLESYRNRGRKHNSNFVKNIITIDLYNILLHGLAEKGAYERYQQIFHMIEEDGLKFNEQTYAAIFECLGRLEADAENLKLIEKHINQAEEAGFTLHQIMDRSKFVSDQRDMTLDAIQRIRTNFKPIYTPPVLTYSNPLLQHLNADVQPITETMPSTHDSINNKYGYSSSYLQKLAREQLQVELEGHITIKSIEKTKEFANADYCREKLQQLEQKWRTTIAKALQRDLNTLRAQVRFKPNGSMSYYTYLCTLNTNEYTDILLQEIYKLAEGSETFSPTVGQLYKELGLKVQQKFQVEQKKRNGLLEKVGDIFAAYCEQLPSDDTDNTRQKWQRLVHYNRQSGPSMDIREIMWPSNVLTGVGRFLYNILMRDIKIDAFVMRQKSKTKNMLPAFYTLFRNHGRLVKEEVKPHPVLARLLRASKQQTLTFDSSLVPMLCPPQPWSTPHNGGYLLNRSDLIRLPHQAIQQWERINNTETHNLYPALDSLNQLASIPWRVNTDILDVIIKVFQDGGDEKLDVPCPPNSLPPLPSLPDKDASLTNADRAKLFKEKMGHRRKQAEMYSLWCDALYRLSLANHYRERVFWLPHNMDFRGRVYPLPPHLNHLGSDLARSMLIFDKARPLGVDGYTWLKLHCINLTGMRKRDSVRERIMYAEEIMHEILDSADNPLTGRRWWAQSDEPWQTLACCTEIAKVERSEDRENYMSHFPIHQDGSCNGLQHYAALGRDEAGAISVNLAPAALPQDVYSAVATLVEKTRKTDAANGLHVAQCLEGFVRRKVIKQTVMTTVYGVTRYGARLQIARQLKDIDDFPKDWVWPASTYLTTKTFESLREMFTSTREIQDWFTECARLIAGVCGQNVEWVTPLGLPVVQPYNRQEFRHVARSNTRVSENMATDMYERPNVMKQKNAFPPNFIHSLDSSHMMLTSLNCERAGLTFVSVHDCFWTHACTVPEMNKICREQFVALHSEPILENLAQFMQKQYSFKETELNNDGSSEELSKRQLNRVLRQLPRKGQFDLRNVLNSVYFFS